MKMPNRMRAIRHSARASARPAILTGFEVSSGTLTSYARGQGLSTERDDECGTTRPRTLARAARLEDDPPPGNDRRSRRVADPALLHVHTWDTAIHGGVAEPLIETRARHAAAIPLARPFKP